MASSEMPYFVVMMIEEISPIYFHNICANHEENEKSDPLYELRAWLIG
jgi:hypothetical protein